MFSRNNEERFSFLIIRMNNHILVCYLVNQF